MVHFSLLDIEHVRRPAGAYALALAKSLVQQQRHTEDGPRHNPDPPDVVQTQGEHPSFWPTEIQAPIARALQQTSRPAVFRVHHKHSVKYPLFYV